MPLPPHHSCFTKNPAWSNISSAGYPDVMEKRPLNRCLSTLTLLHVIVTAYRLWKHSSSNSQTIPRRLHTEQRPGPVNVEKVQTHFQWVSARQVVLGTKISPVRDWRSTPLEWLSSRRDLDLDLGLGHTAHCRASVIEPQGPLQVQGHTTQKLGQTSKIRPDQI